MKKNMYVLVGLLLTIAFGTGASAQQKQKSIMDYYLDLPDEAFYCEIKPKDLSKEFKKKQIKKSNLKAGYILANSENSPLEAALFTDAKLGITVVAVNRPAGAGSMCGYFKLMQPTGKGGWKEFEAFPSVDEILKAVKMTEPDYEFVLPETGTDIKIVEQDTDKVLALIGWSNGKFFIKKNK